MYTCEDSKNITVSSDDLEYINKLLNDISRGRNPYFLENDFELNPYFVNVEEDQEEILNKVKLTDPTLKKMYKNIKSLYKYLMQINSYSLEISHGNLKIDFPPRQNYLAASLKELHSNLLHLTWKVNQVAKGNFNHRIEFMGEIAESFNLMLESLETSDDRVKALKQVIKLIYLNTNIMIIVLDTEARTVLFGENEYKQTYGYSETFFETVFEDLLAFKPTSEKAKDKWELHIKERKDQWFSVDSMRIKWTDNKTAMFHMLIDITDQKEKIDNLQHIANIDRMTGAYNHTFAMNLIEKLMKRGEEFSLCFVDLDGLKKANDIYGHNVGDNYILKFTEFCNRYLRKNDDYFCRLGGDEFLIISKNRSYRDTFNMAVKVNHDIYKVNKTREFPFKLSFSFGVEKYNKKIHSSVKSIIDMADKKMYIQKKEKKCLRTD